MQQKTAHKRPPERKPGSTSYPKSIPRLRDVFPVSMDTGSPAPPGEIRSRVNDLSLKVDQLEHMASAVADRLNPILQSVAEAKADEEATPNYTPLGSDLGGLLHRLSIVNKSLESLLNSIAL